MDLAQLVERPGHGLATAGGEARPWVCHSWWRGYRLWRFILHSNLERDLSLNLHLNLDLDHALALN